MHGKWILYGEPILGGKGMRSTKVGDNNAEVARAEFYLMIGAFARGRRNPEIMYNTIWSTRAEATDH